MARNPNSTRHKGVEYDGARKQARLDNKVRFNATGGSICAKCKMVRGSGPGEPRTYTEHGYKANDDAPEFEIVKAPKCITNAEYDKLLQEVIIDKSD